MKDVFSAVATEMSKDASTNEITELIFKHISRRKFLIGTGATGLGVASLCIFGCGKSALDTTTASQKVFVADALGMVVHDPALCVQCRRCESACTGFNQGVSQPSIANVKVNRNMKFGVAGIATNGLRGNGDGSYNDFRVVADTCRQCPHPVPCQLACPQNAIEIVDPVNARVVNLDKCIGCGICVAACPWAMTALNGTTLAKGTKSNKCTLCAGNPECVQACVAGALTYIPWADKTKIVPPRQVVPATIQLAAGAQGTCSQCH
jgi:Fe-S-cluster-containing dehydrogenase component